MSYLPYKSCFLDPIALAAAKSDEANCIISHIWYQFTTPTPEHTA